MHANEAIKFDKHGPVNILFAAMAAIAVQPAIFILRLLPDLLVSQGPFDWVGFMLLAVAVVGAVVVLILGIPAFLVLRKLGRLGWTTVGAAGLLLGSLPVAFFWPSQSQGYSAGQTWHGNYVDLYIDGRPTIYAWLIYGEDVLFFGLHGLIGALVFYAVWRRFMRSKMV